MGVDMCTIHCLPLSLVPLTGASIVLQSVVRMILFACTITQGAHAKQTVLGSSSWIQTGCVQGWGQLTESHDVYMMQWGWYNITWYVRLPCANGEMHACS